MSKMDNLRALREARYEQDKAARPAASGGTAPAAKRAAPRRPAKAAAKAPAPVADSGGTPPADAACGHRAISGRTCTRPAGHAEKNHRYA
jgi:hypothetical protein